jgi:hypothetical protein
MRTRSLVVGYFHPIFLTNSDTPHPRGAHLLLQLRTRVLNDSLADDFHRWHPGFTHVPGQQALAA